MTANPTDRANHLAMELVAMLRDPKVQRVISGLFYPTASTLVTGEPVKPHPPIGPCGAFRIEPLELEHTRIVKSNGMLSAYINRWCQADNDGRILDPLPIGEAPSPGPYGNFAAWNRWLGEQLMYCQSRNVKLSAEEVAELITIANYGARFPDQLKAAAVNPPSDD